MGTRRALLFGLPMSVVLIACSGSKVQSDSAFNPHTPLQDSLVKWFTVNADSLDRSIAANENECDLYYLGGDLFAGWAQQVFEDTDHRYRYLKFEEGKMVWQIGYYSNGTLGHDFRMKNCANYGPSRMWRADGTPYIEGFYSPPGVKHGIQRRWFDNGVLAMEAEYDHGSLKYEKTYDEAGNPVSDRTGPSTP